MIDIEKLRELISLIARMNDVCFSDVVDALTGTCWDEEIAGDIKGRDDNND